jgi:hypothetical protein
MASSSKRQTTMAKIAREQALREKRANKQRRKEERLAAASSGEGVVEETDADMDTEMPGAEVEIAEAGAA